MNCGSLRGWQAHKAANTRCCKWCEPYDPRLANPKKQAVAPAVRKKPGPKPKPKPLRASSGKFTGPREPAKCGTNSGYKKHRGAGEPSCEPCKEAAATYARERYVTRPRKIIPCGTESGRSKHVRANEPVCEPCRLAYNQGSRDRYNARQKAEAAK